MVRSDVYAVLRNIHTTDMDASLDAGIDWDIEGPIFTNVTDVVTWRLRPRIASQLMGDLIEIIHARPD